MRAYRPRATKPKLPKRPTIKAAQADAFKQARRLAKSKKPK